MRRTSPKRAGLLAVVAALAGGGCLPEPPPYDLEPPTVVATSPAAGAASIGLTVIPTVTFSEQINARFVAPPFMVLAVATLVDGAFLTDLNSGGIGSSRLDDVVPVELSLDATGTVVTFTPLVGLAPGREYALVISEDLTDLNRNPLMNQAGEYTHFESRFTTEAEGPVASLVTPTAGATGVPLNLEAVAVSFSAPVRGVDATTFRLEDAQGTTVAGSVDLDAARTFASRSIGIQLQPSALYTVAVSEAISDDEGRAILPQRWSFTTAACADNSAPILSSVATAPRDVTITVTWTTDEPSDSSVGIRAIGACPAAPADATGPAATCAAAFDPCNPQPASCTHRVVVSGLCPSTEFELTPRSSDSIGNRGVAPAVTVSTTVPQARPVISEVLADATTPEELGEFIEIVNDASVPWDVTGWKIAKITGASSTERVLVRNDGTVDSVPAGGAAVYAVRGFEASRYGGLPAGVPLLVNEGEPGETSLFGNGLSNSTPPRLELRDPAGNALSVWPAEAKCGEGKSSERFDLGGADDLTNVGCTTAPTLGVPP